MSEKVSSKADGVLRNQKLSEESLRLMDQIGRITRNPIGLRNERGEKGSPLTLEDFLLARSNFHFFFYKDNGEEFNIGRTYRRNEAFQQWLNSDQEGVQKVVDELGTYQFRRNELDKQTNEIVPLPDDPRTPLMEQKLYEAYLHMREYVEDDRTLFK